jgi:hypothetical protein
MRGKGGEGPGRIYILLEWAALQREEFEEALPDG